MTTIAYSTFVDMHGLLFAARGFTNRSRISNSDVMVYIAIGCLVIGAVSAGLYFGNRAYHRWKTTSHGYLFRALCGVHHLPSSARALLRQVASHHSLPFPTLVFIDPAWSDPSGLGALGQSRAEELAAIRKTLFG